MLREEALDDTVRHPAGGHLIGTSQTAQALHNFDVRCNYQTNKSLKSKQGFCGAGGVGGVGWREWCINCLDNIIASQSAAKNTQALHAPLHSP